MAERSGLRGSRLGTVSYETDAGVDLAPRTVAHFDCPRGHVSEVTFSVEADVPGTWECRTCGAVARNRDITPGEGKPVKPARTHWDMLLERRTEAELEDVLAERLALLREARGEAPRKTA